MDIVIDLLKRVMDKGVTFTFSNNVLNFIDPKNRLTNSEISDIAKFEKNILRLATRYPLSETKVREYDRLKERTSASIPICIKLGSKISLKNLNLAWKQVVEEYSLLKSSVERKEGVLVYVPSKENEFEIKEHKLKLQEGVDKSAHLQLEIDKPFTTHSQLVRAGVLVFSTRSRFLLFTISSVLMNAELANLIVYRFLSLYNSIKQGEKVALPGNLLEQHRQTITNAHYSKSSEVTSDGGYWNSLLGEELPILKLPVVRGEKDAVRRFIRSEIKFNKKSSLKKLIKKCQAEPACLFLSLFIHLLYKMSGQKDIIVGLVKREHGLPFSFNCDVNELVPIRTRCDDSIELPEFVKSVKTVMSDCLAHSKFSLTNLLDEYAFSTNDLDALAGITFEYQTGQSKSNSLANCEAHNFDLKSDVFVETRPGLNFIVVERNDSFVLRLNYRGNELTQSYLDTLLERFEHLLDSISWSDKPLMNQCLVTTKRERQSLLSDFNSTQVQFENCVNLHDLFVAQAKKEGGRTAVIFENQELTYGELLSKSKSLAVYIRSLGTHPDELIGLCTGRDPDMLVGMLAILIAGCAYVPLDPEYPDDRLSYILADSQAKIVLTQSKLTTKLEQLFTQKSEIIEIDTQSWHQQELVENFDFDKSLTEISSNSLAYTIYTSGSTGKPKGVAIEHRSAVALVNWASQVYGPNETKGVLASTSICFDLSVFEIFLTLSVGGAIILANNALELDSIVAKNKVTLINTVPSAITELLRAKAIPASVKTINLAGEPLLADLVDEIYQNVDVDKVYDLYGPSEDTTYSTFTLRKPNGPQTIGRPIANTRAYILDNARNLQPIGVPGELYLSGEGLAREYLNHPELTQEKFIDCPFEEKARMYRTGDLARWNNDGTIEYLGRIDNQVKVRGHRIEVGEIEAYLNKHSQIKESVVVTQGELDHKKLIAFYVNKDELKNEVENEFYQDLNGNELVAYLSKDLPAYMIPQSFHRLSTIPLTQNGKINRRELENLKIETRPKRDFVAATSEAEHRLVKYIAGTLGLSIDEVSVNDNFFELGGHSLLGYRLITELQAKANLQLTLKELFEAESIRELCQGLEPNKTTTSTKLVKASADEFQAGYPLSYSQEQLWTLHKLQGGSSVYNVPKAILVNSKLDINKIQVIINKIVETYQSLRTIFPEFQGKPKQLVLDHLDLNVDTSDLSHYEDHVIQKKAANKLCQDFAMTRFDLEHGPLLKVNLIKLAAHKSIVMLTMHHIISDDWSINIILKDLHEGINGIASSDSTNSLDEKFEYTDYCVWQRTSLAESEQLDSAFDYWQTKLSGAKQSLGLLTDYPRANIQSLSGGEHRFSLGVEITEQLKVYANTQNASLFMTLLTVFKVLLYRYTGNQDVCVGSVVANRQQAEFENLVGMFVNTLALRTEVLSNDTFSTLLRRVKSTCLEAIENQDAPFDKVVELSKVERNSSMNPLFQVMLILQNVPMESLSEEFQEYPLKREVSKFDFTIEIFESDAGLQAVIEYNTQLYNAQTIKNIGEHFKAICVAATEQTDVALDRLDYLSASEKQQILEDFNQTEQVYQNDLCIHSLFEETTRQYADKVAVVYKGQGVANQQLTYQELYQKSFQLALYLQSKGVSSDTLVGLYVDRSIEMLIGMLAILQAGGAYLPLDPDFPQDRIQFMLEDSSAAIVLTQDTLRDELSSFVPESVELFCLDTEWNQMVNSLPDSSPKNQLKNLVSPQNLAYVIYTSGSTGRPKGVMIEHRAFVNFIASMAETPGINQHDKLLAITTISFDIAGLELFLPLVYGAQVCICPKETLQQSESLLNIIADYQPTLMQATPATWQMLFHAGWKNKEQVKVLCGGEALTSALRDEFSKTNTSAWNMFGPTETTVWSSVSPIRQNQPISIGKPIANTRIYILDNNQCVVPIGVAGELYIAGDGLARGYLNRAELTQERFINNPYQKGERLYRTGDLARWIVDGTIEYLGRVDTQVKIRGFRIETGEIENQLQSHPLVSKCAVVVQGEGTNKKLVAFYTSSKTTSSELTISILKAYLVKILPKYMLPAMFVELKSIPLTPNGKTNRLELQNTLVKSDSLSKSVSPKNNIEDELLALWAEVLEVSPESIGINDNFFEIGGNSLNVVVLASRIEKTLSCKFNAVTLFKTNTIKGISQSIQQTTTSEETFDAPHSAAPIKPITPRSESFELKRGTEPEYYEDSLAIVGISCHLPQAEDHWQFWDNLCKGKESVSRLTEQEIENYQVDSEISRSPQYVPTTAWLEGKELFDPGFFNLSSGIATLMDPQFRQLLMHSWKAVEDAGYICDDITNTSVFISASNNFYQSMSPSVSISKHVMENSEEFVSWLQGQGGTIPTMISYQLGFTGQSSFIHTNCSSSLTALYSAYQSLQSKDVDYALVGAASFSASMHLGYMHQPGLNLSSDGHCRTFDAKADGLVEGEGVGVVLVKRASDAIANNDNIYCLIRGVGVNNDGNDKAGFYAPSVNGQASVIQQVLRKTKINPETIHYVEAHGTGTALGDPIEIMALKEAYQEYTDKTQFCGIGSVKPNIGHLDTAAGLVGLVKLSLSLDQKSFPALINYQKPNHQIDFENSPFYVLTEQQDWSVEETPKRAALSSFGIGGTNTHAILEEYIDSRLPTSKQVSDTYQYIVPLSAKRHDVLIDYATTLFEFLQTKSDSRLNISDVAYTLQIGRKEMQHRAIFVVNSLQSLMQELKAFTNGEVSQAYFYQHINLEQKAQESLFSDEDFQALIQQWVAKNKATKLAKLWVEGEQLNWRTLYKDPSPRRISLPTYPFAKEPFWIEGIENDSTSSIVSSNAIHPLLHVNTSDLGQQSYTSTFNGRESFLVDHVINNQKIFPAVAYLELARAAINQATPDQAKQGQLQLSNVVWARPMVFEKQLNVQVNLTLSTNSDILFEILSISSEQEETEIVHCQGTASYVNQQTPQKADLTELSTRLSANNVNIQSLYKQFRSLGTKFGPAHRGLESIHQDGKELLAKIMLPSCVKSSQQLYFMHPSVMDAILQASTVLIAGKDQLPNKTTLPFALDKMLIFAECRGNMSAWIRYAEGSGAEGRLIKLDIDLYDESGNTCARMSGYSARLYSEASISPIEAEQGTGLLLARPIWEPCLISSSLTSAQNIFSEQYIIVGNLQQIDSSTFQANSQASDCKVLNIELQESAESYQMFCNACFEQVQKIIQAKPRNKILVQILVEDTPWQRSLLGLSGLLETAGMENPNIVGQVILVEKGVSTDNVRQSVSTGMLKPIPNLLLRTNGQFEQKAWKEFKQTESIISHVYKAGGVYLITGGLGQLGILFAKEIIEKCNDARVILTGRSEFNGSKKAMLDELTFNGSLIEYRQLDLSDFVSVRNLLITLQKEYKQLNGILHCAGMIADNFIFKKDIAEFNRVLEPKVTGTYNIDLASKGMELDFVVLFSSESSLGSIGQSDYAVANGFMDQFAAYRNHLVKQQLRTGKTLAINWPLWKDGGMTVDAATLETLHNTSGMVPMSTNMGMQAFYLALNSQFEQILVIEGDVDKISDRLFASETVAISEPVVNVEVPVAMSSQPEVGGSKHEISNRASSKTVINKTQDYLAKQFSELFKMPAHKIDPSAALESYGIDSIMAINLINQLEKTFGSLSKTLLFEYQTVSELAEYFVNDYQDVLNELLTIEKVETIQAASENVSEQSVQNLPKEILVSKNQLIQSKRLIGFSHSSEALPGQNGTGSKKPAMELTQTDPIAIIGLSGRYPEAPDLEQFWNNLRDGKDCIIEIPKERWDWKDYYTEDKTKDGHHYSKWGGFIAGVDEFDPRFFNISPKEAEILDPQERLFLQHAWKAVEDSGYTRKSLQISRENNLAGQIGVYVGVMYSEYQLLGAEASLNGNRIGFANSLADIANRVSYVFNFHGPSMTVDTMCSSSLTAVHLACQDLKLGQTDIAVAGGVNVNIHPNKYLILSSGQYISTSGHCHSFGVNGDGYTPGEGVGAVILKRLKEAERDGDHIYGLIKGSTLNHGGKTNGYTVPNPKAQADAISQVLRESRVDPRSISYIEAHGTGTKLGDPIEISALSKAFYKDSKEREVGFCQIGSAKSNIGHCESAAGIAGLTKVLLQMKYKKVVPSLHSTELNPHIDFAKTPFMVNQELRDWEQPIIDGKKMPRIAGISSFGAGGANAHMIIEEYQSTNVLSDLQASVGGKDVVIPLSARTEQQLIKKTQELLSYIESAEKAVDLTALAYTLQVGRESMEFRVGVVVNTMEQLVSVLNSYLNKDKQPDGMFFDEVKKHKDYILLISQDEDMQVAIDKWIEQEKLTKLLELWVKGLEVNWKNLYQINKPSRISLPTYPFSNKRYWWDSSLSENQKTSKLKSTVSNIDNAIHRLLHVNRSVLGQQSYSTLFDPNDNFLFLNSDSSKILTPTVYLEMIHAAVEHALGSEFGDANRNIELQNVTWGQPITFDIKTEVSIALLENDSDGVDFEIYSIQAEKDVVLCQGSAVYQSNETRQRLDVAQLKTNMLKLNNRMKLHGVTSSYHRGEQYLLNFDFGKNLNSEFADFSFNPVVLDTLMQSIPSLLDGNGRRLSVIEIPFKIDSLKAFSTNGEKVCALITHRSASVSSLNNSYQVDIDICDEDGNVSVSMQGVQYQLVELESEIEKTQLAKPNSAEHKVESMTPKEIDFIVTDKPTCDATAISARSSEILSGSKAKPNTIKLKAFEKNVIDKLAIKSSIKPKFSLDASSLTVSTELKPASTVKLFDYGQGIYKVQLGVSAGINQLSKQMVLDLNRALEFLKGTASVKVVIFYASEEYFLVGGENEFNFAVESELYKNLVEFPYPTIASVSGNASGAGFVFASLCDFLVGSNEGRYSYSNSSKATYPSIPEYNLFKERFGERQTNSFILSEPLLGASLANLGWGVPFLEKSEVMPFAERLASNLVSKPRAVLSLLKAHLARHVQQLANQLVKIEQSEPANSSTNILIDSVLAKFENLQVESKDNNTLIVTIKDSKRQTTGSIILNELISLLENLAQSSNAKIIVLQSEYDEFIPNDNESITFDAYIEFRNLLINLDAIVVGAIEGDAQGVVWLLCQSLDQCFYSRQASYSYHGELLDKRFDLNATVAFNNSFGREQTKRVLLRGMRASGEELKIQVPTLQLADKEEVRRLMMESVDAWEKSEVNKLILLKKSKAELIFEQLEQLEELLPEEISLPLSCVPYPNKPMSIDIDSSVIHLTAYPEGILVISMQDKQEKNMFSNEFVDGMRKAFQHIGEVTGYKAVILIGYANYFASGGTKDALLAIHQGEAKFTDIETYHAALACKIPVIAAMQGHAIGAGWSMGMFADFVLFSGESKFLSPYVNYGFTPGAGSTLVLTDKLGYDLARENLLTARYLSGSELQKRGLAFPVLPRKEILSAAMSQANQIASSSVERLVRVKQLTSVYLNQHLAETYRLELDMHEKTFVGRDDALESIESRFLAERNSTNRTVSTRFENDSLDTPIQVPMESGASLSAITEVLKKYLADELHLEFDEIDGDEQFIDVGLDSITGVTWVRKINERFQLKIEATKVYSYPTLNEFAEHVKSVLGSSVDSDVSSSNTMEQSKENEVDIPAHSTGTFGVSSDNVTNSSSPTNADSSSVIAILKEFLAQELHMDIEEVDEDAQFIDLGLDSITGVTWVRKINDEFELTVEATKVYSYPTLAEFGEYVSNEMNQQDNSSYHIEIPSLPEKSFVVSKESPSPVDKATYSTTVSSVSKTLAELLAVELHLDEDDVDVSAQFVDLGLDSITGVTWVRKINDRYQLEIEATKVYSHPTLSEFSNYVASKVGQLSQEVIAIQEDRINKDAVNVPTQTVAPTKMTNLAKSNFKKLTSWRDKQRKIGKSRVNENSKFEPVAVIGMAGRFPQAKNTDEFWNNIKQGKNCISEIPKERWISDDFYQQGEASIGKTNSKWMGVVDGHDLFDPLFFNISPAEAEFMDPQQRLYLQSSWHCIENAGYNPRVLSGSKCGVFVGCSIGDYNLFSTEQQLSAQGFTGNSISILAARISYFLNLQGPCISIETACSSSLVAISNACDSLNTGASDIALAGGVHVMSGPSLLIKTAQSGMLSSDGKCFAFDQRANGFVAGEGVGVVMLKRLSDAERDNDIIQGVVQAWGVNQDGKTNGITAPNPVSQMRLQQDVYNRFNIDPANIQLIEAHGTGTKLGDPLEVDGLKEAFKKFTNKTNYCALGSVKSNIGHCVTAAGVAGFIKLIYSLKTKTLPPTINYETLNEHILLEGSPFFVNNKLSSWEVQENEKRQAAISSFGFSGTNAHVVISEYDAAPNTKMDEAVESPKNSKLLIPLSAKTNEQLEQKVTDLLDFIRDQKQINLLDMAYTLQVGREAMEERLVVIASSVEQLVGKLEAFNDAPDSVGRTTIHDLYLGNTYNSSDGKNSESKEELATLIESNDTNKLAQLWVNGIKWDWNNLYGKLKPQRINLPCYPFAKEKYWLESNFTNSKSSEPVMSRESSKLYIHPLLQINKSDLAQQSYQSNFNGNEFFLRDHRVQLQKSTSPDGVQLISNAGQSELKRVLPGVAYLEIARAALENASPDFSKSMNVELHNTVWVQPLVVEQEKQISISVQVNDNDDISYEVFSQIENSNHSDQLKQLGTEEQHQHVTHCQGQAVFVGDAVPATFLDIDELKSKMVRGSIDGEKLYERFRRTGLDYGPAHQGVKTIYQGDSQVLAEIVLPPIVDSTFDDYWLHPCVMDSALQASLGLHDDSEQLASQPSIPFSLEVLRIVEKCEREMFAWIRYSSGSQYGDKLEKFDIDLCDSQGNVCVQMRGFSTRVIEVIATSSEIEPPANEENRKLNQLEEASEFDDAYYEAVIEQVLNNEISVDEAAELG